MFTSVCGRAKRFYMLRACFPSSCFLFLPFLLLLFLFLLSLLFSCFSSSSSFSPSPSFSFSFSSSSFPSSLSSSFFWDRSSSSPGWPWLHYVANDNLELLILLPPCPVLHGGEDQTLGLYKHVLVQHTPNWALTQAPTLGAFRGQLKRCGKKILICVVYMVSGMKISETLRNRCFSKSSILWSVKLNTQQIGEIFW